MLLKHQICLWQTVAHKLQMKWLGSCGLVVCGPNISTAFIVIRTITPNINLESICWRDRWVLSCVWSSSSRAGRRGTETETQNQHSNMDSCFRHLLILIRLSNFWQECCSQWAFGIELSGRSDPKKEVEKKRQGKFRWRNSGAIANFHYIF